jgi:hypothetical protein
MGRPPGKTVARTFICGYQWVVLGMCGVQCPSDCHIVGISPGPHLGQHVPSLTHVELAIEINTIDTTMALC